MSVATYHIKDVNGRIRATLVLDVLNPRWATLFQPPEEALIRTPITSTGKRSEWEIAQAVLDWARSCGWCVLAPEEEWVVEKHPDER